MSFLEPPAPTPSRSDAPDEEAARRAALQTAADEHAAAQAAQGDDRPSGPAIGDPDLARRLEALEAALADNERRAELAANAAPAPGIPAPEVPDEPRCPTCGAGDINPSGELLPHCWACGHVSDEWPSQNLDDRRRALAMHRLGIA